MTSGRIRTLFISHDSSLYGAQLSLLGLLSAIDRNRFDCAVVTANDGPLVAAIQRHEIPVTVQALTRWVVSANGIKVHRLAESVNAIRGLGENVRRVLEAIAIHRAQLVYTNTITCIDGALAARRAGLPHIWHLREHLKGNDDLESLLPATVTARIASRMSRQLIVNSNALRNAYEHCVSHNKLTVVHNGIDVAKFAPNDSARATLRSELGVEDGAPLIGIIGSITPGKGHFTFVDAAAHVLRYRPDAVFAVVGHGDESFVRQVREKVSRAGATNSFHFLGWRSDVIHLLPALSLLVIASDQEAFGRTVIEGMACSLPVVSTRSGGPEEIIVDGRTGFLVPVGDGTAMGDAILRLVSDPDHAHAMGAAGRRRAIGEFSLGAYSSKVQDVIANVATGMPRAMSQA